MNTVCSIPLDVVDYVINEQIDKLAGYVEKLSSAATTAYVPSYEEQADMQDKEFGVILWHPKLGKFNKFAMSEPGITEINLTLLSENMEKIPDEIIKIAGVNLCCAAKKFKIGIPENLKKYASDEFMYNTLDIRTIDEARFVVKTANTPKSNRFALPKDEKYPIDDKLQIIKAAAYFKKHHNDFAPVTKLEFALNTVSAAKESEVELVGSDVEKYAGLDTKSFNADFSDHLAIRQSYLKDNEDEFKELYAELKNKAERIGPNKTASVLYELDKKSGLAANYGHGIEDPLITTFAMKKIAGKDIDGVFVSAESLKNIPSSELTPLVGNDVIPELKSDEGLEVLASLPTPIRKEVLELL